MLFRSAERHKLAEKREGRVAELEGQVANLKINLKTAQKEFDYERETCTKFQLENADLKQQLASLESDVDTLTDCDEVVKELAETKQQLAESEQFRANLAEAKDKVLMRNRELEAENATLKQQLEEALAKLAQYEGIA